MGARMMGGTSDGDHCDVWCSWPLVRGIVVGTVHGNLLQQAHKHTRTHTRTHTYTHAPSTPPPHTYTPHPCLCRFYTLMVLATALFDKPAFKNLVRVCIYE